MHTACSLASSVHAEIYPLVFLVQGIVIYLSRDSGHRYGVLFMPIFLDKSKQRIFITKEYFSEGLPQTVQSRLADTGTCLVNLVVIGW